MGSLPATAPGRAQAGGLAFVASSCRVRGDAVSRTTGRGVGGSRSIASRPGLARDDTGCAGRNYDGGAGRRLYDSLSECRGGQNRDERGGKSNLGHINLLSGLVRQETPEAPSKLGSCATDPATRTKQNAYVRLRTLVGIRAEFPVSLRPRHLPPVVLHDVADTVAAGEIDDLPPPARDQIGRQGRAGS